MEVAIAIFPLKLTDGRKGILPHHLWPKSIRYDVDNIRRRVKILRRLPSLTSQYTEGIISDTSFQSTLWQKVRTLLLLRTYLSPHPKDHASIGLMRREDLEIADDTSPSKL